MIIILLLQTIHIYTFVDIFEVFDERVELRERVSSGLS